MIQIMQQERSFLRRVKSVKPFIYENYFSSRPAYFSIRLAVKTSRPHIYYGLEITNSKIEWQKYIFFRDINELILGISKPNLYFVNCIS